ncbi:MAG: Gfo/Idh/MocA family protein [Acidimicrobiales bacterium]
MRIGVAGVGRIGAFHARVLGSMAGVTSLVLADLDGTRAEQLAAELGAEPVGSVGALLSAGVDGLVVATATGSHAELVTAAADAGLPVFCEKPLALELEQFEAVVKHVEHAAAAVQVGFQRRFDLGFAAARAAVASGELGRLHTISSTTFDPEPPTPAYVASSGGIFKDLSVHDIDAVRWVTGREVVEVVAAGSNRGGSFFAEHGDVDTTGALLRLEDDTLAVLSGTRYNAHGYDVRLEVFGTRHTIGAGFDERSPFRSADKGVSWPSGEPYRDFMDRFHQAYVAELSAFTDLVAGRCESACTPADSLQTAYVAEACELSRLEHRWVAVEEVRR